MNPDRSRHPATSLLLFSLAAVIFSLSSAAVASDTDKLVVISNDEVVGTLEATQVGQRVQVAYAVDNNGRGPKANETLVLSESGFPLSWEISGSSLFGAAVSESYHWEAGTATWQSQADSGTVNATEPPMYIGGDSSPWALGMYVRALLAAHGHELNVLPSGRMKLQTLESLNIGESELPITIYELSGIQMDPQLVALDANQQMFASFSGGSGLIRSGHEASLPVLQEWARGHELRRLQQMQSELAHRFTAPIRYRNVRVFDSVQSKLTEPVSVLVGAGRIQAIEAADAAGDPSQEVIVDGEGGTLVPGLFDMHSHASMDTGLFYLAAGVTSTRDMGNDNDLLAEILRATEAGELAGPRITPDGMIEARSPHSVRLGVVAENLEEALAAVRWYAANGYFEIKTYNSMNPDWVVPLVQEARKLGLGVTGHVPAFMSPDAVIEAGYDSIAHINQLMLGWLLGPEEDTRTPLRLTGMKRAANLDLNSPRVQKTIALMKQHGTSLDTTSVILERVMLSRAGEIPAGDVAYLSHMPIGYQRYRKRTFVPLPEPGDDAEYQAAFNTLLQTMKLLYDNNIRMLPGTDDGTGFTVHRELELYVKAGIPAAETLRMATLGSAEYLKVADEVGSIESGKHADFLLVDGNPVQDISAIRNVRLVSRGGVIYFPAEIYAALGIQPFAPAATVNPPSGSP
jgi:imidazolonepropionase-like amidohydrolase